MSLPAGYLPARDRLQVAGSSPCCVATGDCSRSPSSNCPYGLAAIGRPFAGGKVVAGHPCKGLGHGQPPMHVDNMQVVAPRPLCSGFDTGLEEKLEFQGRGRTTDQRSHCRLLLLPLLQDAAAGKLEEGEVEDPAAGTVGNQIGVATAAALSCEGEDFFNWQGCVGCISKRGRVPRSSLPETSLREKRGLLERTWDRVSSSIPASPL
ncbi:hypothetical protein BHM03_00051889 [Ensete ventricosum]|nr:hypothetical protein BHM03_00051889 [Ensete ventricosum]